MFPAWTPKRPNWKNPDVLSLLPKTVNPPPVVTLEQFIEKSDTFFYPFPIDTVRCKVLKNSVDSRTLEDNINSAYPIMHENVLYLCAQFILFKRQNGNNIEKKLYKTMNLLQLVDRLLNKRAITFCGQHDFCIVSNGKKSFNEWESIGTDSEKEPLTLNNCLSYDEIKLSALTGVSSLTYFINDGKRHNRGEFASDRSKVEDQGVIIGLVGARLTKPNVMEHQEIVITKPTHKSISPISLHKLFASFYEEERLLNSDYKKAIKKHKGSRLLELPREQNNKAYFDGLVFCKRVQITIDTLFVEANYRAQQQNNSSAYIHVVGFGLGVWKISPAQDQLFMDCCAQRISALGPNLHNVSDIRFAWINSQSCGTYKDGDLIPIEGHPLKGIKIHINQKNPHEKLTGSDQGKLMVVSFPWDGNALPGNEFWDNSLSSSGDPAAASSTQVSEIHNTFINPKVCAQNLRIVSDAKVLSIQDFIANIFKK